MFKLERELQYHIACEEQYRRYAEQMRNPKLKQRALENANFHRAKTEHLLRAMGIDNP